MLKAVVTYTEKLAFEQAAAADKLLAKGVYLGDLSLPNVNRIVHLIVFLFLGFTLLPDLKFGR